MGEDEQRNRLVEMNEDGNLEFCFSHVNLETPVKSLSRSDTLGVGCRYLKGQSWRPTLGLIGIETKESHQPG